MALIHGIQRSGTSQNALKQMAFFHSSTSLQVKLSSKYKNRTRYKGEDYHRVRDPSYMPSIIRQRGAHKRDLLKWTLKLEKKWEGYRTLVCYEAIRDTFEEIGELFESMPVSEENRNWEAYLKSQGEWENFCKKFIKPQDVAIEWPRPCRHGEYKKSCSSLDSDHEEEDDVWDSDDPTFGAGKTESKSATERRGALSIQLIPAVTIGERAHRVTLGLPPVGSLTMKELKAAFHTSALKWHPDRHNGSSKDMAEEKFRACVNAFRALCMTLISRSREPGRDGSAGLRVVCWTTPGLWEFQRSVEESASARPPPRQRG